MPGTISVYKFGGTSLATSASIMRCIKIVENEKKPLVVVVSAMGGVTDRILHVTSESAKGNLDAFSLFSSEIQRRYATVVYDLVSEESDRDLLLNDVKRSLGELSQVCQSLKTLKELPPRILDSVIAEGERFSAMLFQKALISRKREASLVDASKLIFLAKKFDRLSPDLEACKQASQRELTGLLESQKICVVPGFIGLGPEKEVCTLGRGGSDYSATILGSSLEASSVTLFKEVDGILTVDPRHDGKARVVEQLHYREATELAYYGAKVLHPQTITPLIASNIPLLIKNFRHPKRNGTLIHSKSDRKQYPVKALTAMENQVLITVSGRGMIGVPGIAGRTFSALAAARISLPFITQASSEASLCFVVSEEETQLAQRVLEDTFHWEIKHKIIDTIQVREKISVIAVVGLGMVGTPGIAARTFQSLAKQTINIIAIAQGSSELNISFALDQGDVPSALKTLHKEYRLDKMQTKPTQEHQKVSLWIYGFGQIGQTLAQQIIQQENYFKKHMQLKLSTMSLSDQTTTWFQKDGFTPKQLRFAIDHKRATKALLQKKPSPASEGHKEIDFKDMFDHELEHPILVDLTASDTTTTLLEALEKGFHLVLANKKAIGGSQKNFDTLLRMARERQRKIRYEATVGAGLPIIDTIWKLIDSGDAITSIVGCLSGSLGFIFHEMERGQGLRDATRNAQTEGLTEPDPVEDLSGQDVARKALILARTFGIKLEYNDVELTPVVAYQQKSKEKTSLEEALSAAETDLRERFSSAFKHDQTLRYMARITKNSVRVGIERVDLDSPFGKLRGRDNQICIYSKRYRDHPLLLTGPGAGAEVTAAGVLSDIIALATQKL